MDSKVPQGVAVGSVLQLALPDQGAQNGVGDGLGGGFQQLLPQLRLLHARVEGVGLVVVLQQPAAVAPQLIEHGACQIAARQRLQHTAVAAEGLEPELQLLRVLVHGDGQLGGGGQSGALSGQGVDQLLVAAAALPDGQTLQDGLVPGLVLPGRLVQDHAAADGLQRGEEADDEAVAPLGVQLLLEPQLGVAALAGLEGFPVQQDDLGQPDGGTVVEMDGGIGQNGALGIFQILQPHIQHPRGAEGAGLGQSVAPGQVGFLGACQIDGHPLSGVGGIDVLAVDLEIADPGLQAARLYHGGLAHGEGALDHGAGDDGAEALHGEYPVDGQAEGGPQVLFGGRCTRFFKASRSSGMPAPV